jgi:hypothetical protein
MIETPEELVDHMTNRLQIAQDAIRDVWTNIRVGSNQASPSSSSASSSAASARGNNSNDGFLTMDGNWWFWNILFAVSPAILIGVYCQFVVIPEMKRRNLNTGQQETISTDITWTDSLRHFMEYLQLVEPTLAKQQTKPSKEQELSHKNEQNQSQSQTDNDNLLEQIETLKFKLQSLEEKIQGKTSTEENQRQQVRHPRSNIRQRYLDDQQIQQQRDDGDTLPSSEKVESNGRIQRIISSVRGWWSGYLETMKDAAPPQPLPSGSSNLEVTTSPATVAATAVAMQNAQQQQDQSQPPPPPTLPANKGPCKVTRSITHPRDHESEHPLWTLWHKPTD